MESNTVNFNYEYDLFQVPVPAWMERVLRPSMECLYFYCDEKIPLATSLHYSAVFLSSVSGKIKEPDEQSVNWWGEISDISKLTNCKLKNHEVNKFLNFWTPDGGIVHTWSEIDDLMKEGRWRLKDPWMMGGTGQWRIDRILLHDDAFKNGIEARLKKGALLLEKSLEVKRVLGTTFELSASGAKQLFTVENDLNSQGNFQGGAVVEAPRTIQKELSEMANYWLEQGVRGILEIDSFEHKQGWYPCVEVNHRRTMGWFIWQLEQRFGKGRMCLGQQGGKRLNPIEAPIPVEWLSS